MKIVQAALGSRLFFLGLDTESTEEPLLLFASVIPYKQTSMPAAYTRSGSKKVAQLLMR